MPPIPQEQCVRGRMARPITHHHMKHEWWPGPSPTITKTMSDREDLAPITTGTMSQGSYVPAHTRPLPQEPSVTGGPGAVFSYKLRYIVGFWLVEMAISTNQKPTIYRNLYENTGPGPHYCMNHEWGGGGEGYDPNHPPLPQEPQLATMNCS